LGSESGLKLVCVVLAKHETASFEERHSARPGATTVAAIRFGQRERHR
jgi:hypothetical protein